MEDRETPRMHKYGESKRTRILMATVPHVTAWAGLAKYQAAWFLLNRMYNNLLKKKRESYIWSFEVWNSLHSYFLTTLNKLLVRGSKTTFGKHVMKSGVNV